MRGFILKDLYIIRKKLIAIGLLMPFMMLIMNVVSLVISRLDTDSAVVAGMFAVSLAVYSFTFIYSFSTNILFADERRKWNMYAASSEAGVRAVVGAKFTLCFILFFAAYLYSRLEDVILSLIYDRHVDYSLLYLGIVFVLIFITGLNLFCGFAFGARYGNTVRIAATVVLAAFVALYMLFGNIEWIMGEDGIANKLKYILENMESAAVRETAAKLSGGLTGLICMIPHVIVASYYLCYRLACRFFTRGAVNYDK